MSTYFDGIERTYKEWEMLTDLHGSHSVDINECYCLLRVWCVLWTLEMMQAT